MASLAARVKAEVGSEVPMTIFGRGLGYALKDLAATDFDVVGLDWQADPRAARESLKESPPGACAALQGNLDPCALYGTRESLRGEVTRMLEAFGTVGHIANLGHGMQPTHDPEMAGTFVELVQEISAAMVTAEQTKKLRTK